MSKNLHTAVQKKATKMHAKIKEHQNKNQSHPKVFF